MFFVVIMYAVLASTFMIAKNALTYSSPCFLIGFRMTLAGCILLGYRWWRFPEEFTRLRKNQDFYQFFVTSLFHIYFAFIFEFWALQYLTALKTVLIYSLTPFISALLAYFIHKEQLTIIKVLGIIVGTIGIVPIIFSHKLHEVGSANFLSISLPEIVLFFAVFSAASAWFLVKRMMGKGYHFSFVNGITMLIGGILSLFTSLIVEGTTPAVTDWASFFLWVFLLILCANVIFYNMYGWLMNYYSITFISFAGFLCPTFATFFEWAFMSCVVTWHHFFCLTFVTCGLYLFYRDELLNGNFKSLE